MSLGLIYFLIIGFIFFEAHKKSSVIEHSEFVQTVADQDIYFFDEEETFVRIVSWNIHHASAGKEIFDEMNLLYRSRQKKNDFQNTFQGIVNNIELLKYIDIIMLQDLDFQSRRSYQANQHEMISAVLPDHGSFFSENMSCPFFPFPLFSPSGEIHSGISLFSKLEINEAKRYALPVYPFYHLTHFILKPCFTLCRFSLRNGTYLVVINVQNQTYRSDPQKRQTDLLLLRSVMLDEYERGNFVVAGGTWNQNPPKFDHTVFSNNEKGVALTLPFDMNFFPPGWQCSYDPTLPTFRLMDTPYSTNKTETSITDYFIVSPNIEINSYKTINLGFENSTHNPIMLEIYIPLSKSDTTSAEN